jgi:hypothetical protein
MFFEQQTIGSDDDSFSRGRCGRRRAIGAFAGLDVAFGPQGAGCAMTGIGATFVVVLLLSAVHLLAIEIRPGKWLSGSGWLSFAGGLSTAYVFVHIIPDLAERQQDLSEVGPGLLAEREVFLAALSGLVAYYGLEHVARKYSTSEGDEHSAERSMHVGLWLHAIAFSLYSVVIGYLLSQQTQVAVTELAAFAVAFGLHFFVNDQSLQRHHGSLHKSRVRWMLAGSVVLGWLVGAFLPIPDAHVTFVYAFLAGGMILNILKEELPEERRGHVGAFVMGAVAYGAIALAA